MSKIKIKQMVCTSELLNYAMRKYNMSNNEWHEKIWRPFFIDCIIDGPARFDLEDLENPTNIFEEQIKDFLLDNPELNNTVTFYFDN
jgi:hypothetical protein